MDKDAGKRELMNIDRAFSDLSREKGSVIAFYVYMADDGIILPRMDHPFGKDRYRKRVESGKTGDKNTRLTWEPLSADVAESGDLGYTHGKYTLSTIDTSGEEQITEGYYVTIWKKQADDSWKFVFDTGNELVKQTQSF